MATKMTHTTRAELTNAVRRRYGAATGGEKRKILDEFIAVTGYHEKSAIRALNAEPVAKTRHTRVRASLYDEAVRAALIVLWEASDRVCGKRLRALLPILLPALERNGHLHVAEPIRQKIVAMSASTIDRLLRVPRSATRLKKVRRAMPAVRRRIDDLIEWGVIGQAFDGMKGVVLGGAGVHGEGSYRAAWASGAWVRPCSLRRAANASTLAARSTDTWAVMTLVSILAPLFGASHGASK